MFGKKLNCTPSICCRVEISPPFIYPEIAELLGKRETNCRKLMSRARSKMGISGEEPVAPEAAEEEWVHRFVAALEQGNVDHVLSLLTEDVLLVSDGGGKVIAAVRPVKTRDRVARFFLGMFGKASYVPGDLRFEFAPLNGQTGIVLRSGDETVAVAFMYIRCGKLANIYIVRNPDKLARV